MCFSASVSFAASALLLPAGVYSLRLALQHNPGYLALAAIPLAFGVQQACEGLVWLGLAARSPAEVRLGAYGFLAFAYWFWLFWAPWAVAIAEANPLVRRVSWSLGVLGFAYGALLYLPLVLQPSWLTVQVVHHAIEYDTRLLFDPWFSQEVERVVYALIILIPFALASSHALKGFGATILLSAIASHWLLHQVFVSVWCFFAALLSLLLIFICQAAPQGAVETGK
ncbi:hypothetical protein H6F86_06705 [Phormidium sp. FACHB-592]|uniref:Uncharacterized protein n=1 Tax=Stenomitos frigidus AS-A4 TaxID=2933935 RepID=A0ABV0KK53_9CYAN|nr:DUF6629 family protein [Phormidium sp. FACHB-592]MBD2073583.1 hypothetical protein [Phormidium sp. FACHB-592]